MQLRDLDSLPPTLCTREAAELFGVSPDLLWRLAREGTAPVVPLRMGRALRWPTRHVLSVLGIERDDASTATNGEGAMTAPARQSKEVEPDGS